jgi:hypothetical protein
MRQPRRTLDSELPKREGHIRKLDKGPLGTGGAAATSRSTEPVRA